MKRRWNVLLWAGFLVVLVAPVSYFTVFVRYPATRDVPWAPLPIFAAGLALIGLGLKRAFRNPAVYRGRVAGSILMVLGVAASGLFSFGMFVAARQLPRSSGAPQVGGMAPDFTLPDKDGRYVTLSRILEPGAGGAGGARAALLIFYRGYW